MDFFLNRIQFLILVVFLSLFYFLLFEFLFTRKPITKILVLGYAYNIVIFFLIYNVFIFKKEKIIFEFVTMSIFGFILNVLNGIFIINNILAHKNEQ
jgi:hypothetical protein